MNVTCQSCGVVSSFAQPYAYHAGFGNQAFLYSDSGLMTLTWSSYGPQYSKIVGNTHPWSLTESQRNLLASLLIPAPDGTRWRFANVARCFKCGSKIGDSILNTIYFLVYEGSVRLDDDATGGGFLRVLRDGEPSGR